MKKFVVIMLALFLAVPALTYAGSATSRFDMTVGGAINFDFGYAPQSGQTDSFFIAYPDAGPGRTNLYTDRSSFYFSAADSNFNFTVKGPDAWGAKTTGFLGVNFRGGNSGNAFGGAQIQHAAIRLNWKNSELLLGKTFQQWGEVYGRSFIIAGDFGVYMNGGTLPTQIAYRYWWTKNFNTMIGIVQATEWQGVPGGGGTAIRSNNDSYGRNGLPYLQYEIAYETDACGKIGPNGLKFGLGGILGREKKTQTVGTAAVNSLVDDTAPVWTTTLRGYVPIIPEKKGNKTNAMYFTGNAFIGQNMNGSSWLAVPSFFPGGINPSNGSYWRPAGALGYATDVSAPTFFGGMLQLTYYIQDNVFVNAQYGYLKWNYSEWARGSQPSSNPAAQSANETDFKGPNRMNMNQQYGLSIMYDPSPNLRFGLEWMRLFTHYNGLPTYTAGSAAWQPGGGAAQFSSSGTADIYKIGAMYFF